MRSTIPACLAAALAALALACPPAAAGEEAPKPAAMSKGRIKGPAGDTVFYRYQPGKGNAIGLVQAVLARYGLNQGKEYHLDRNDALGLLGITGPPKTVALVRSLIEFLEEERPQVRLKVRIVESYSLRDLQAGFNYSQDRKTNEDTFFQTLTNTYEPKSYLESSLSASIPYLGSSFNFATDNRVDSKGNFVSDSTKRAGKIATALRVIGEHQESNTLAQPDLLISPGSQATIKNIQKYPFQEVLISGGTAVVNVNYLNLGVTLAVTPHLAAEDRIEMNLSAEVMTRAGFVEIGPGTKYPYTSRRLVQTSVIVPSGFEVVIGGLYQKEYAVVEKGVPLLSDIPLLGYLFKSYWRVMKKKELLFFLQPELVKPKGLFDPGGESE